MGFHGGVGHVAVQIGFFQQNLGLFFPLGQGSAPGGHVRFRGQTQEMLENIFVVQFAFRLGVFSLDFVYGLLSHIRQFMEHGRQVAFLDNDDAFYFFGFGEVRLYKLYAVGRRPEDLGAEHSRYPEITGKFGLTGDLFIGVAPGKRLAHDLTFGPGFQGRDVL